MKYFTTKDGFFSGNVGIGTTSPQQNLEIKGERPAIRLNDDDPTNQSNFEIVNNGGALGIFDANNVGLGNLLHINGGGLGANSGNVGIGTTSPQGKLNVIKGTASGTTASTSANNIVIDGTSGTETGITLFSTVGSAIRFGDDSDASQGVIEYSHASDYMRFITNAVEAMRIDSDGNVGIGTTSPSYELEIQDSSNDAYISVVSPNTDNAGILFGDTDASARGGIIYDNDDNSLAFRTNDNTDKMFIDSAGSVGIGTTSPVSFGKLAVVGSQNINVNQYIGSLVTNYNNSSEFSLELGTSNETAVDGGATYRWKIANVGVASGRSLSFNRITRNGSYAEAMRIDSAGRVGIGTTDPDCKLDISTNNTTGLRLINHDSSGANASNDPPAILFQANGWDTNAGSRAYSARIRVNSNYSGAAGRGNTHPVMNFDLETNEDNPDDNLSTKMMINADGNVGIGTTSPGAPLHISHSTGDSLIVEKSTTEPSVRFKGDADTDFVLTVSQDRFKISPNDGVTSLLEVAQSGNVGIGTTSPDELLHIANTSGGASLLIETHNSSGGNVLFGDDTSNTVGRIQYLHSDNSMRLSTSGSNSPDMLIDSNGNVGIGTGTTSPSATLQVVGSLSKSSGSFKIDHPVKPETHDLVHSFVEAPQADNIYRGKVDLVAGKAEVNIDSVAGMTEGTFVLLNREIQVFTSNESDWDAVRGKVEGNKVIIECQNAESTATISWLVIGERQDKHMYDTEWTDDDGKVIVEPLKPQPEPEYVEEEPVVEEASEEPVAEEAQAPVSIGASISSTSLDDISNSRAEEL